MDILASVCVCVCVCVCGWREEVDKALVLSDRKERAWRRLGRTISTSTASCFLCVRVCVCVCDMSAEGVSSSSIIFRVTLYWVLFFMGNSCCFFPQTFELIAFANGLTDIQSEKIFLLDNSNEVKQNDKILLCSDRTEQNVLLKA